MAISFIDSNQSVVTTLTADVVLTKPTGTASGDVILVLLCLEDADSSTWDTVPTGFRRVVWRQKVEATSAPAVAAFLKVAGGSEPSDYTFSYSEADGAIQGHILTYRGVDNDWPLDTAPTLTKGLSTGAINPNPLTTRTDGAMHVVCGFQDDNDGITTAPSGYSSREATASDGGGGDGASVMTCDKIVTTAGVDNPGTFTSAGSAEQWASVSVALRESGATAPAEANFESWWVEYADTAASVSHYLTTKSNRMVLAIFDAEATTHDITAVTYNGESMTLIVEAENADSAGNSSAIWGISEADLPTGGTTYTVAFTGGSAAIAVTVVELNNVNATIPTGTAIDSSTSVSVATDTATVTAPTGNSIAVGTLGHGDEGDGNDSPPTGTGTWLRGWSGGPNPPSGAYYAIGFQRFTSSGTKDYTETRSGNAWNRASMCVAVFAEDVPTPPADDYNAPFFGCNF